MLQALHRGRRGRHKHPRLVVRHGPHPLYEAHNRLERSIDLLAYILLLPRQRLVHPTAHRSEAVVQRATQLGAEQRDDVHRELVGRRGGRRRRWLAVQVLLQLLVKVCDLDVALRYTFGERLPLFIELKGASNQSPHDE